MRTHREIGADAPWCPQLGHQLPGSDDWTGDDMRKKAEVENVVPEAGLRHGLPVHINKITNHVKGVERNGEGDAECQLWGRPTRQGRDIAANETRVLEQRENSDVSGDRCCKQSASCSSCQPCYGMSSKIVCDCYRREKQCIEYAPGGNDEYAEANQQPLTCAR